MAKDYYKILGITDEEKKLKGDDFNKVLKKKYRKIAIEKHPDKQTGKTDAEKKKAEEEFKEASEAYDTLLNKREEYDNPKGGFEFNGPNFNGMDIDDILKGFGFGGMDFGFSSRKSHNVQVKGASIRVPFSLTLEEIYTGVTKKIRYKRLDTCEHCGGSGMTENSRRKTCKTCGGMGMVHSNNGFFAVQKTCPTCGGRGTFIENPCTHCKGIGVVEKTTETEINIPKGMLDGMSMVLTGKGNAPRHNQGTYGDLIINVRTLEHKKFDSKGNDLYFPITVNVIDAILGREITIETIDGKQLTTRIPQGTNHTHKMRFKGYGLPKYNSNNYGDMIGVVNIIMPSELNNKEKEILEKLKEEEHFKTR